MAVAETGEEILARAQELAPRLRERSEEIERLRRLPEDVVAMMRDAGVFRMGFGRDRGGPEMTSEQQTRVVEALAHGDASAGWCAMIGMSPRRQWDVLSAGGTMEDLTPHERAALPLSRLHAFRTARSIVTRLYDLVQTASIYRPSPLDRWLRDTTTMCRHVVAQDRILQTAGAYLLGGAPAFPLALGITR
ncbi:MULTISPECIES: acyl-CoA dehydrogenase family protein [Saccharothrix]|uniref:acyl-CoA dehydrogenase family protein n=1 Tax=Saccharothrix TaxID=2071 RepID=UPI000938D431|nr:acyl-CoA dehydrogenase family protein [Saccharothrix sp. CB00851]OKI31472.1 hypothetical protein A6A25_27130 [Saccharothrix sp. CB00851]